MAPRAKGSRKRRPKGSGACRQLPSGRWQASIVGEDGLRHTAPQTFDTKMDADAWLASQVEDMEIGTWTPPSKVARTGTVEDYASQWLATKTDLRPRTLAEYRRDLDNRVLPTLGDVQLRRLTPAIIRRWYAQQGETVPSARAHAYDTLRNMLNAAVEDELLDANPCRIRGASRAKSRHKTRPATVAEIEAMAAAMPERYRAMLLVAAWCGLRFGELTELRRGDVDLDDAAGAVLRVRRAVVKHEGRYVVGDPKSEAGVRDVAIPPHVVPAIRGHLDTFVGPQDDALLFPSAGDPTRHLSQSTLTKVFYPARQAAGRPDLRWHDLRHTGATLAAITGATLADLQARLGHSTVQAAMIYQHAAQGRDQQIAARMSEIALGEV